MTILKRKGNKDEGKKMQSDSKKKNKDTKPPESFPPETNLITRTTNVSAVKNLSRRSGDHQTNNSHVPDRHALKTDTWYFDKPE